MDLDRNKENRKSSAEIKKVAGEAAYTCFGVVGMANIPGTDGIVYLLGSNDMTKGVKIAVNEAGEVLVDMYVIMEFGVNMETVSENLAEAVKYNVETETGYKVRKVTVHVPSVRI
ncbi:MAG: Asp23/Gls24 family envelope stress response protein [Eubacteriaceae bacterium]|nr:Asp23/Gls24 family envelope stress response protein [Eubacteriaceae bacterium]